ncbi:L,D-transpeptidase [Stappia sp. ES.058]|uniref:L,D-transpeptidase n=1 Tax=Stappia sp. ES.058 TaxID=1881061 RepID=UPI00087C6D08|nr:L,D-transpeptidase [Stappia sp. ES.058]SDT91094.1 Lipoprotein-anchoring transpeptidase ErfK/SrfK [Stappia sp. ES.058]
MHRSRIVLMALALACAPFVTSAQADYRSGAGAPPLLLSPDLTEPWVLQLQPNRRAMRPAVTNRPLPRQRQTIRRSTARAAASAPSRRQRGIDPRFLPSTVAWDGKQKPGTIVIDTRERYLYLVEKGGFARRYGVGVGRPGFEWAGTHKVSRKAEWPDWRPPAEMRQRQPNLPSFVPGGPKNPLGARALYLGSTLYRIHGSNEPWTIGRAVSSGCIRMRNEDVTDLYNRVPVGARVQVI